MEPTRVSSWAFRNVHSNLGILTQNPFRIKGASHPEPNLSQKLLIESAEVWFEFSAKSQWFSKFGRLHTSEILNKCRSNLLQMNEASLTSFSPRLRWESWIQNDFSEVISSYSFNVIVIPLLCPIFALCKQIGYNSIPGGNWYRISDTERKWYNRAFRGRKYHRPCCTVQLPRLRWKKAKILQLMTNFTITFTKSSLIYTDVYLLFASFPSMIIHSSRNQTKFEVFIYSISLSCISSFHLSLTI
jgi:hypothetical protein